MTGLVDIILNMVVTVAVAIGFIFIAVMLFGKMREKPLEWPDLQQYGEPAELWIEGMEDLEVFPQYGYHRYRDVYMNMRRVPVVVLGPERVANDEVAYKYIDIKTGEQSMDLPQFVMLLGTEKPAKIVSF